MSNIDEPLKTLSKLNSPGFEKYVEKRAANMKALYAFVRQHPEGVTCEDLKAAGISQFGLDRAIQLGAIRTGHKPAPERGPKAYKLLFRPGSVA